MNLLVIQSIVSIVAGILIFAKPQLLSYIVAAYLILAGAVGLGIAYG
jgi:lipoprotein signal peptidase